MKPIQNKEPREILSNSFRSLGDPKGEDTPWGYKFKNCPNIYIFDVIYRTLELKIQIKAGRPKILPRHYLNNSRIPLKKSKLLLFRPPKLPKMNPQNGQNEQISDLLS